MHPRSLPIRLKALSWTSFLLLTTTLLAQTEITFTGTGVWSNPAGWDLEQVPGSDRTAVINSGTLTIDGNFGVGSLRFGGGTLQGEVNALTDSITLVDTSRTGYWRGGSLNAVKLVIGSGATFEIDHTGTASSTATIIEVQNGATVDWLSGNINLDNGGIINNSGEWNAVVDARIRRSIGAAGTFNNLAGSVYRKQGSLNATFDERFNNDGTLFVEAGSLIIAGQGTTSASGVIDVASTASLTFSQSYTIEDAASLQGTGSYLLSGGTLTLDGISLVALTMNGGALTGDHTFAGGFQWNNGDIQNGTTLNDLSSSFEINDPTGNLFNAHQFTNQGTVSWNDGDILLNNGSTITNNGSFQDQAAGSEEVHRIRTSLGTSSVFSNNGFATYTASGGGTTEFDVVFNNQADATVSVTDGSTLIFDGTGTAHSGSVIFADSSSSVAFDHDYVVEDAYSLQGEGQFSLTDGTLSLTGPVNVPDFTIKGGTLLGNPIFAAGATWQDGILGQGMLTNLSDSLFNLSDEFGNVMTERTITNQGLMVWNDGDILLNNASLIINQSIFEDRAAAEGETHRIRTSVGTGAIFSVATGSSYTKTGDGTTEMEVSLTIDGDVDIQAGTFAIEGPGSMTSMATIQAASGAAVNFNSVFEISNADGLLGDGAFSLQGGTLTMSGVVEVPDFTLNGGTLLGYSTFNNGLVWNNGTLGADGYTTIGTESVMAINDATGNNFDAHNLYSEGQIDWNDGDILLNNGSSITSTGTFNDDAAGSGETHKVRTSLGSAGYVSVYTDSSYNKTSEGTTEFNVSFFNDGTTNVHAGKLVLTGGGYLNSGSTLMAEAGTEVLFANNFDIYGAEALQGDGQFTLSGGSLSVTGDIGVNDFRITGGSLTGGATFLNGATMTGGSLANASLTNASGSTFVFATPTSNALSVTSFLNEGQVEWTSGDILLNFTATITNSIEGTWIDSAAALGETRSIRTSVGSPSTFTNFGTYEKNGEGTTRIDQSFANHGLVNVNSGTLILDRGGITGATGMIVTADGAKLEFDGDYEVTDALSLQGDGQYTLKSGTLTMSGNVEAAHFTIAGGSLQGTNTFSNNLVWNDGILAHGGLTHTALGSSFFINDPFGNTIDGNTLITAGDTTWNDGDILVNSGATITNSGTWNDLATAAAETHLIRTSLGSGAYFTNQGTYEKSSPGTTGFNIAFYNDGEVNVSEGTLLISGGGSALEGSTFNVSSDATLSFTNSYVVNAAESLTGSGRVTLEGGELNLNGVVEVTDFEINGGTLSGSPTFTANVRLNGGSLGLFGTTTNASGSTFTFANPTLNTLSAHSLENFGEVRWESGSIRLNQGAGFTNFHQVFDETTGDVSIASTLGLAGYFFNQTDSLYQKVTAGTTTVDVSFVNYGDLEILAGTMRLIDGSFFSDVATATVEMDAVLEFDGNTTIADAAGLSGDGVFTNSGGILDLTGNLGASLILHGGSLTGNPTISGTLQLDDGQFGPSGTTTIDSSGRVLLNDLGGNTFVAHTVINDGTTEIIQGNLRLNDGSSFENRGSLLFDSTASGGNTSVLTTLGLAGSIDNTPDGIILQQGAGTTTFQLPLDNDGTIEATAGSIVIAGGGTAGSEASFFAYEESGSSITFSNSYTVLDLSALQGDGSYYLRGGTLTTSGVLEAELIVDGGVIDGGISIDGHLRIINGGPLPGHNLTINSGGRFTLDSMTASTLSNAIITVASGGTLQWNRSDIFLDQSSAVLNSGTLVINTPGQISPLSAHATQILQNDGNLFKRVGSGDTVVNVPVFNTGYIELQDGRLLLSQNNIFTRDGTVLISGGVDNEEVGSALESGEGFMVSDTEIVITGGTTTVEDASTFSGNGTLMLNGGVLNIAGDLHVGLVVAGGNLAATELNFYRGFAFDTDTVSPGATLALRAGAHGLIDAPSFNLSDISLQVDEDASLTWQLSQLLVNGNSNFTVEGLLIAEGDQSLTSSVSSGSLLKIGPTGEFRKTTGTGTTLIDIPLDLEGRLEVQSGTVELANGGSSDAGVFDVWTAGELKFTDGYIFDDESTFTNGGRVKLLAGAFEFNDDVNLGPAAQLAGGTYSGTHTLNGTLSWTGGEFDPAGVTTIAHSGVIEFAKSGTHELNRDFTIDGQLIWLNGDINGTNATLTNNGNVVILTDGTISSTDDSLEIQNNGIFAKVGGFGTTTVDAPFTNDGLVFGAVGTLHFADTFDLAQGTLTSAPGAFITFAAPLSLSSSTVLAGNGTITADITTGGTVSPGSSVGTLTINGDLTLTSGAISFFEIDVVNSVLTFDRLTVSGTLELAGDLEIDFLTTVDPISTDMFTLYTAATLQGEFANVANGGQVWTALSDGGRGLFTVNYGPSSIFDPNSVILSNFEFSPIPEPSTWLLMVTGLLLIGYQSRRRRA